jgi:hypothetical protein
MNQQMLKIYERVVWHDWKYLLDMMDRTGKKKP